MKRGIIRIIIGSILIALQIVAVIGNSISGTIAFPPPVSLGQLVYDLVFYLSYYSVGIIGVVCLISGLCAFFGIHLFPKRTKKTVVCKRRYCKLCGNLIDQSTKKCTGCGKQYFRMPVISKSGLAFCIVIIVAVVIVSLSVYRIGQYQQQISQLNSQVVQLEADLNSANQSVTDLEDKLYNKSLEILAQKRKISDLESENSFFNRHVVFVLDNGTRQYHKYSCSRFIRIGTSFWAYNIEAAKNRGYKPCELCN